MFSQNAGHEISFVPPHTKNCDLGNVSYGTFIWANRLSTKALLYYILQHVINHHVQGTRRNICFSQTV